MTFPIVFSNLSESPARRAIWRGRTHGKHSLGRDLVHVPMRWPRTGRAVIGGEGGCAVEHCCWPSLCSVRLDDAPSLSWIDHLHCLTFHDQVEVVRGDCEDTVWIACEVLRFARGCTSVEVKGA